MAGLVEPPAASTSSAAMGSGEDRQIAIRLTTRDSAYTIPSTKFMVPSSWRRFHLSELINKVLEISSPIPFDFLIDSTLLRSSLGAFCAATGTSEEVTLDVEYLPSTLPPQLASSLPSDDWVSEVCITKKGSILASSYAGTVSVNLASFPPPSNLSFHGHDLSVLSCCFVHDPLGSISKQLIASGSMDRSVRVWEYEIPTLSAVSVMDLPEAKALYSLALHTAPVASVRSRPLADATSPFNSPHLLTAGWDGVVGVWDLTPGVNEGSLGEGEDGGERRKKRRKQTPGTVISKSPVSVLVGHTGKVARAVFDGSSGSSAYSAGWDHTVRSWDLTVASESGVKTSDKVLLDMTQMASRNLLATGSTDRTVCFWDLREESQTISLILPGHSAPVSSVAAHPTSPLLLASGSYDATVRIWDARSPKQALFVLPLPPATSSGDSSIRNNSTSTNSKEKILSVDWDGDRLAAGGEGKRIIIWNVNESSTTIPTAVTM